MAEGGDVICGAMLGRLGRRAQLDGKGVPDGSGDIVLNFENVIDPTVVSLRPDLTPVFDVHKLDRNTQAIAAPSNTALEHLAHAQLTPNLANVAGLPLELESRRAGGDLK